MLPVLLLAFANDLTVDNIKTGEILRYPVAMIRGQAKASEMVRVKNLDNRRPDGSNETFVRDNRYVLLVELIPGKNRLEVTAEDEKQELVLTYRPGTGDYKVNFVYLTANDGGTNYITQRDEDPQNYRERISTAAKLMQTFTAESLNDQGLGRKTFNLELDRNGQVVVHTLPFQRSADDLRKMTGNDLWSTFYGPINNAFPMERNKNVVIMSFTDLDPASGLPRAHTALGGGGLGLFGSGSLFSWPSSIRDVDDVFASAEAIEKTKVHDDSAGRNVMWGLASTTIGATLHEMGHTFGLPHTADPNCIMSRGFDRLNRFFTVVEPPSAQREDDLIFEANEVAHWSPFFAAQLSQNPWLQPDLRQLAPSPGPQISVGSDGKVKVTSPRGIAFFGWYVWKNEAVQESKHWLYRASSTRSVTLDTKDLPTEGEESGKVILMAIDGNHAVTTVDMG